MNKNKKSKKIKLMDIVVFIFLTILFFILFNTKSNLFTSGLKRGKLDGSINVKNVGLDILDGKAPFDKNNEPGNDSSPNNRIVRANDTLIYNLQPFLEVNNSEQSKYGKIIIEGYMKKQKIIDWDVKSIKEWINEEVTVSEDKERIKIVTDYDKVLNELGGGSITVNIPINILVSGAKNGTVIKPEFTMYMEGASENEKYKVTEDTTVTVSSAKRYTMELITDPDINDEKILDDKKGQIVALGLGLVLKNDNSRKQLLGIEYPQGDFTADIDFNIELFDEFNKVPKKDISSVSYPKLYNYKINSSDSSEGKIKLPNNLLSQEYISKLPEKSGDKERDFRDKDGNPRCGDIEVNYKTNSDNKVLNVRFFDYILDENNDFPIRTKSGTGIDDGIYYISAGAIFVHVPYLSDEYINKIKEENKIIGTFNYRYEITGNLKNIKYKDDSNSLVDLTSDKNKISSTIIKNEAAEKDGNFSIINKIYNGEYVYTKYQALMGTTVKNRVRIKWATTKEEYMDIYGYMVIHKFDDKGVSLNEDGKINVYNIADDCKRYYITKKDGTSWKSDDEMNNTRYDGLNFYETKEKAEENGKIVAIGIQTKGDKYKYATAGKDLVTDYELKLREDAKPLEVYQFVTDAYAFFKLPEGSDLKQNGGDPLKGEFKAPTSGYGVSYLQNRYIKAEYDKDGRHVSGTDMPSNGIEGCSLRTMDSESDVLVTMEKPNNYQKEGIYNLGKHENIATFKIQPILKTSGATDKNQIRKVEVGIEYPTVFKYIKGTAVVGGKFNPETNLVEGGKHLDYIIAGMVPGEQAMHLEAELPLSEEEFMNNPIYFQAEIPLSLQNATNYKLRYYISVEGLEQRGGLFSYSKSYEISIINSLTQIAIKSLENPVIELDGSYVNN